MYLSSSVVAEDVTLSTNQDRISTNMSPSTTPRYARRYETCGLLSYIDKLDWQYSTRTPKTMKLSHRHVYDIPNASNDQGLVLLCVVLASFSTQIHPPATASKPPPGRRNFKFKAQSKILHQPASGVLAETSSSALLSSTYGSSTVASGLFLFSFNSSFLVFCLMAPCGSSAAGCIYLKR